MWIKELRILLSNDDGIFAPGIAALYNVLKSDNEVYVVAPDRERSAAGHGITVHRPLRVKEADFLCYSGCAWVVDGTPVDCIKLGLEALLPQPPDLIISGINLGPNLGTDVLYSGTVSAAIEGLINGIPSLAVSIATYEESDFTKAGEFTRHLLSFICKRGVPSGILLNVNVPPGQPRGVKITSLGNRRYINIFHKRQDPRGRTYYWIGGEPLDVKGGPDTDIEAVKSCYISITPLHFNLTDYKMIEEFKKWPFDFKE